MPEIVPMRALRYTTDDLSSVIAPPYDVIGPQERAQLAAQSPHNIVHLDLPEGEGDAKYTSAQARLDAWIESGILRQDDRPRLLAYEQEFSPPDAGPRQTRRGFFALVRAEPYEARAVLPHERTLSGPKEDRYRLYAATRAALSPVFLLYSDPSRRAEQALSHASPAAIEFSTPDGIVHRLGAIEDVESIRTVVRAAGERPLLIADGHHRYETAVRYAAEVDVARSHAGLAPAPRGAHRYVLAFLANADDPSLVVFPTHRMVHGLDGFSGRAFLESASRWFDVQPGSAELGEHIGSEPTPSFYVAFADGYGAILRAKENLASHPRLAERPAVLRDLDVVILHTVILEGLLGIDPAKQVAQSHLRYLKSAATALDEIRAGKGQALFLMRSTPVDAVRAASEAGEVMPQKSTYFFPKVPTGLAIHRLLPETTVASV